MDWTRGDLLTVKTDNAIKLGVDEALKDVQFQRRASTWYLNLAETILVVDIQKSSFGAQYYVNLGVLVKGLAEDHGSKLPPREHQCHIRTRIEALKPEEEEQLRRLLNLEDASIGADERQRGIAAAIRRIALPFLTECSTHAGIRSAEGRGHLAPALVHRSIRDSFLS